jgi:hypothetical protein
MQMTEKPFTWQWPDTGPTPVSYGLDTEIFDTEQFPNAHTFVREAIQNSLDARVHNTSPVKVRFAFHDAVRDAHTAFLEDLRRKKLASALPWPEEWDQGKITWLTVQDFNSTGLSGDVSSRTSDFWNYWLNFGLSNKSGAGRGGRGIGRVTFLIASRINTVLGLTQRTGDNSILTCGMGVLRPTEISGELKTSYAYLAKDSLRSTFKLYDDHNFQSALAKAFHIEEHLSPGCTGLSLAIPYPHLDLTPEKLIAASIENFAPAISSGSLIVEVDAVTVDSKQIDGEAKRVREYFVSNAMREDPTRLLDLIRRAADAPGVVVSIEKPSRFAKDVSSDMRTELKNLLESGIPSSVVIEVPVTRNKVTTRSRIVACFGRAPTGKKPIDMFYREGMALPQVTARSQADVDLIVQANEGELATYLNFCEGKAHLDLLENREVKDKLSEKGFHGIQLKRFVRGLMDDIRSVALPDATQPDSTVMRGFFSINRKHLGQNLPTEGGHEGGKPANPKVKPPVKPPAPTIKPFVVSKLDNGFRIRANHSFQDFPIGFRAEVAYSTGERKPKWSKYDFDLRDMDIKGKSDVVRIDGNIIDAESCDREFQIDVTGFDSNRELDVKLIAKEPADA